MTIWILLLTVMQLSQVASQEPGIIQPVMGMSARNPVNPNPSIRSVQIGLGGSIETDIMTVDLNGDGEIETLLGTSKGLYIMSQDSLLNCIPTSSSVMDIALIYDVTGDGWQEVVLVVGDTSFPNIRCYDGATGEKIWQFIPKQEVFIENLMWTEQQTLTFDIEITDVDSDNYQDVVATSGHCAYAIDGKTGEEIWRFEAVDNLWEIAVAPDLDEDGVSELAVGGQNGIIYLLSGADGTPLWQREIAEKCEIIDVMGDPWATVDRSVWNIIPLNIRDESKALVSSEDGKVRLISLRDGTVEWETLLIEYVQAQLFKYYQRKHKQPTSPWDENFFNLELLLAPDITGDGTEEILALAYTGCRTMDDQQTKRSGLFLINTISGNVLWKNTCLDLEHVAQVETTVLEGEKVLLLPLQKSGSTDRVDVIDLEDGKTLNTFEVKSSSQFFPSNEYYVKQLDKSSFLFTSDFGDLLCLSSTGDVLWDYPRITQVAVERGEFTGDETRDILIVSQTFCDGEMFPSTRVLYVIDGATQERAWLYQMPYEEYVSTGGISGIIITPDLDGDGKQELAGVVQPPRESREGTSEDCRIVVLSGRDGSILLNQPVVEHEYYGIWEGIYENRSLIEVKIRESFEATMRRDLPEEFEKQERERRDQFEQELEQHLNERRQEGASEEELAIIERDRRQELEQNLKDMRDDLERSWRENFEEGDLPRQLAEWQRQLEEQEDGYRINRWIYSLDVLRNPFGEGMAFAVGTHDDIFMISPRGELLWTRTYNPWVYRDPFNEEDHNDMEFELVAEEPHCTCYYTPGDLNGDGIDDLVAFASRSIVVGLSNFTSGDLDFMPGQSIEFEGGFDPNKAKLVSDLDGDGVEEIFYERHYEDQFTKAFFMSPVTGRNLLEIEHYSSNDVTIDLACADFDDDSYADTLVFWSNIGEDRKLEVRSGRTGHAIWEFGDYKEDSLLRKIGYHGPIKPATPISDLSGDGVCDLALVKSLTFQPGALLEIFDVVKDDLVKEVLLEEVPRANRQEKRWHPCIVVEELGDFNGDGSKELATIMPLGDTEERKEFRLLIVDVRNEEIIVDFRIIGSAFIDPGDENEFGVVGLSGDVYFLNVANNLQIVTPAPGGMESSPLQIEWTGVTPGSFNQVFIDGLEVGRTNENELTVPVAEGGHNLTIRSLDEYGRGTYRTTHFVIQKGSAAISRTIIWLVILTVITIWPPLWVFISRYRYGRGKGHG